MAGDIPNSPYTLKFQGDILHSGSISFGRFETEALCWERRSSFSHNRYLEDAEKYSRPGSINEKKAYFEAHFRRRALMKQASSGSHNGTDCQSSENEFSETMSYEYDNFGSFRERSHSARFNEYSVSEREFEEPYSATERGTAYDPQNELQCARPNSDCDTYNYDRVNMQELQYDEVGNVQVNNEPDIKNHNSEVGKFDISWKASNVSSNGHLIERDDSVNSEHQTSEMTFDVVDLSASYPYGETVAIASSEHPDDASAKEMTATSRPRERKSRSTGMKSDRLVVGTQGRKDPSHAECLRAASIVESTKATPNVASKNLVGKPTKKEANDLLRLKRGKKGVKSASPATKQKQMVTHNSKIKPLHLNRSADLESRTRRKVNSLRPSSGNLTPKLNSSINRPMQAFDSSRPEMKQNDSAFSFKSDERPEKRKEFIIKLEKKIQTKEAEMHQLQAKKQEKIVAEIKQLRKSLNFKATPMPSFYHESDNGKEQVKGTPCTLKSSRPLRRNSVAGSETSPSCSGGRSARVSSAGEAMNKTRLRHETDITRFQQSVRPKSSSQSAAPGLKTHARTSKKDPWNEKHQSTQHKDAVSIGKISNKTKKVVDQPKLNFSRSGTRGMGKEMRGGGFGRSARFGNLAMAIAS